MIARQRRTHDPIRARRGVALVAVLLVLALLGVLAVGATFATTLRIRGDRRLDRSATALAVAESIAVATLLDWRGPTAARASAGIAVDSILRTDGRIARLAVTPLRRGRFVVTVSVDDELSAGARAGVWLALRRDSLDVPPLAALNTDALVTLAPTATLSGVDVASADAPGCLPSDSATARASLPTTIDDRWTASLAAHAEVRIARTSMPAQLTPLPSAIDGRCDVASTSVWGEPSRDADSPCQGYLPVVYVDGSLQLNGGRGQGILLVDGDLVMRGDARFVGLVVVRGRATLADDARITGALVVRDVDARGVSIADRAVVARSGCVIAHSAAAALAPRPDGAHAWAPLF